MAITTPLADAPDLRKRAMCGSMIAALKNQVNDLAAAAGPIGCPRKWAVAVLGGGFGPEELDCRKKFRGFGVCDAPLPDSWPHFRAKFHNIFLEIIVYKLSLIHI